jgi:hypothetical protein
MTQSACLRPWILFLRTAAKEKKSVHAHALFPTLDIRIRAAWPGKFTGALKFPRA